MITHEDFYSGALGKLRYAGGSEFFTIPHTISVHPDYTVDVDCDIQGKLVANSLDGRLWLYRNNNTLTVIALKWDSITAKLQYADNQIFSNNDDVPLIRGLDWILTNKNIFVVSDNEPYILRSNLFDANIPDKFLYSILRVQNKDTIRNNSIYYVSLFSSGKSDLDPFTNNAWGKHEDNGNSEGTGFFSKDTQLLYPPDTHTFEQCYSLLPAVGEWQICEHFLVKRPSNEKLDCYNYMQSLRPLTPLEFTYRYKILSGKIFGEGLSHYGTGYNFDHRGVQLAYINGQLWGKGLYHIGHVYILPAVFNENNEPIEFYLYVSADYPCSPFLTAPLDINDQWLNLAITSTNNTNLYGYVSELNNALSSGICITATEPKLFSPSNNTWINLSENEGKLFIDIINSRAMVLDNEGIGFIQNELSTIKKYKCSSLAQWIAPAGKVEAISSDYVIASADNLAFLIAINTGFNRDCIHHNLLPLSGCSFQDSEHNSYRVAISEQLNENNRKVFGIHQIASDHYVPQCIHWQSIYKKPINIEFINSFEAPAEFWPLNNEPFDKGHYGTKSSDNDFGFDVATTGFYWDEYPRVFQVAFIYPIFFLPNNEKISYIDFDTGEIYSEEYYRWLLSIGAEPRVSIREICSDFFYINLDSGQPVYQTLTYHPHEYANARYISYSSFCYTDSEIGIRTNDHSYKLVHFFDKISDIPVELQGRGNQFGRDYGSMDERFKWPGPSISLTYCFNDTINEQFSYAMFREHSTSTIFSLRFPCVLGETPYVLNYPDNDPYFVDHNGFTRSVKNFHVALHHDNENGKNIFSVFHSEIYPDVFDFQSELERSHIS